MSYFDDQEDAWFANDCTGSPDEYNPHTDGSGWEPRSTVLPIPKGKTEAKKARNRRSRERYAKRKEKQKIVANPSSRTT